MSKKVAKEVRFYQGVYLPPLVKAGNAAAVRKASSMKARAAQRKPPNFRDFSKEELSVLGKRGAAKRWANATPQERRKIAQIAQAAYRKLPIEVRREYTRRGGLARWASLTPEQQDAQRERMRQMNKQLAGLKLAKRSPGWPFEWRHKLTHAELTVRRLKKQRLEKFLKSTMKGKSHDVEPGTA